jgi:hypothetical protein
VFCTPLGLLNELDCFVDDFAALDLANFGEFSLEIFFLSKVLSFDEKLSFEAGGNQNVPFLPTDL